MPDRRNEAAAVKSPPVFMVGLLGWLVPGLGHFMVGRPIRAAIFFVVVISLFTGGLALEGELFPMDLDRPLTLLAGVAEVGAGTPYIAARLLGLGAGNVEAVTYEYGYTFVVVAGLLNMLIVLDAYDIAVGKKK